ncbi:kinase-like domain-containing protein [Podospora conica]|nr:kinase-like domain-containing protein [Schizothecium conicum]
MVHLNSDKFSHEILDELRGTKYACSSLTPLSGGNANFIFKGVLEKPLEDGTTEVAIKHGQGYVASNPAFGITTDRCHVEEESLRELNSMPPSTGTYTVRPPKLYHYNPSSHTQVQEFLPNVIDLKNYALQHFASSDPARKPLCHDLGSSLGAWLKRFHSWTELPEQAALQKTARSNSSMQGIKLLMNYPNLLSRADAFPSILDSARDVFTQVIEMATQELQRPDLPVIHGDFWTGNILIRNAPLQPGAAFVCDWEMCELGVRPLDLGQMIAELYELWLYKGIAEAKWLIEGFASGYGFVDDAFAFRVAVHAGAHLVGFGSTVAGWGTEEQVRSVVGRGRDLIVRGWHEDRAWFEAGELACLFRRA